MKKRRHSNKLTYQSLEHRQMLTSIAWVDGVSDSRFWIQPAQTYHVGQDSEALVASNLVDAPEISQQPEHGKLEYNQDQKTLTYVPNAGYTGADSFQLSGTSPEQSVRVWEPVYAVTDWTHARAENTTTIDVLENDYSFHEATSSKTRQNGLVTDSLLLIDWQPYGRNSAEWRNDSTGLRIVAVTDAASGSVSVAEDGRSLIYESADGFIGTDEVTYTVENAAGHRSEAVVTIEVSSQTLDFRYYFSEAQWQQERVDDWLERHAASLTRKVWNGWRYDPTRAFSLSASAVTSALSFDQVANVQEGDIVKSQGNFIYYATNSPSNDGFAAYLSIVDVSDPNSPQVISTTGFQQQIRDMFLDGDRAAVVLNSSFKAPWRLQAFDFGSIAPASFQLIVLDISDTSVPREVSNATIDGDYMEARLIGDELYVVSQHQRATGPIPRQLIRDSDTPAVSLGNYIDALLNRENGFDWPEITVEANGTSETIQVGFEQVVRREHTPNTTLVTTFDLQSNDGIPEDIDLIESGHVNNVYVSTEAIYLFDSSTVSKLAFNENAAGVTFTADGQMNGTLLGQFAADEAGGYLRVVVTDQSDRSVDVRVMQQVDDTLVLVSSLEDIAPTERVYATHFSDDQVFVVTYRKVDPLFIIDLSDPAAPTIAGELKIPGFSNYMQLIGDDLLLAVGRDANEQTGLFGDLQVSLFDISDSNNPVLLDRYAYAGYRSTRTPLVDGIIGSPEQHALTYDPSTGTLALPIYSNTSWNWGGEASTFEGNNSAISLLQVDRENGIRLQGQVDFETRALRTVIVGDHLVYLSENGLKTATRLAPTETLASLDLPTEGAVAAAPVIVEQDHLQQALPQQPTLVPTIAPLDGVNKTLAASLPTPETETLERLQPFAEQPSMVLPSVIEQTSSDRKPDSATAELAASEAPTLASSVELADDSEPAWDTFFALTESNDDAALDTVFADLDEGAELDSLLVAL